MKSKLYWIILAVIVLGYGFFFSSRFFFHENRDYLFTELNTKTKLSEDISLTLKKWTYSKKDKAMMVMFSASNESLSSLELNWATYERHTEKLWGMDTGSTETKLKTEVKYPFENKAITDIESAIEKNEEERSFIMILFVGEQDKGWFIPETAEKKNEKCEYSGFISSLEELSKSILQGSYSAVILHLPSLVIMDYQNIGKFCKNLMIANGNIRIIVMAEGYNINSQIVQAAIASGVRFFMLGTNPSMLKRELSDALDGKTNIDEIFDQLPTENQRDKKKRRNRRELYQLLNDSCRWFYTSYRHDNSGIADRQTPYPARVHSLLHTA